MEEQEEANPRKSKTSTLQPLPDQELTVDIAELSTSHPPPSRPWLDLPDPITELILQIDLPIPDYLRFVSVCRRWRSIQTAHWRRHSPSQPPMRPPLPWLIPGCLGNDSHHHCYSPSDQSFYRRPRICHSSGHRCIFSCHGWILIASDSADRPFSLINPVTAAAIVLPYVPLSEVVFEVSDAMSAPPADPDCTILLADENDVFLYRVNDDLYGVNKEDEDGMTGLACTSPCPQSSIYPRSWDPLLYFLVASSIAYQINMVSMLLNTSSLSLWFDSSTWTPEGAMDELLG